MTLKMYREVFAHFQRNNCQHVHVADLHTEIEINISAKTEIKDVYILLFFTSD